MVGERGWLFDFALEEVVVEVEVQGLGAEASLRAGLGQSGDRAPLSCAVCASKGV